MKPATLVQIRKELETISLQRLMALTLRLIKLKSENKEFVSYLLFDEDQLSEYLADLKFEISEVLDGASFSQSLIAKNSLRKCQKSITKHARCSDSLATDPNADLVITDDGGIPSYDGFIPFEVPPQPLEGYSPQPAFPEMAQRAGVSGKVTPIQIVNAA